MENRNEPNSIGGAQAHTQEDAELTTDERLQWHRLAGLVVTPLFDLLGYATSLEIDLSMKQQLIDIITVRKAAPPPEPPLPRVYWEAFEELNEHNLISFKSYSESFNAAALEEFYGHYTNYRKINELSREQVNLYAIVNHFPQDLLADFIKRGLVTTVKADEIFDLTPGNLRRVRFIVCRETSNPVLGLFSDDYQRVVASYEQLQRETRLLAGVSGYLRRIGEYYGEEVLNMYTEKDYWRDYPPSDYPFAFPWEVEYHKKELQKAVQDGEKAGVDKGKRETARAMRDLGLELALIVKVTGLSEQEILAL